MPATAVLSSPASRSRSGSITTSALEPVHTLRGRAAEAGAEEVEGLQTNLHFLVGHRELEWRALDEVTPAASVHPPPAECGVLRLDALLVLHRFHDVAARHGATARRNLRNALRAARDRLRRARDGAGEGRQSTVRDAREVDLRGGGGDVARADVAFRGEQIVFGLHEQREQSRVAVDADVDRKSTRLNSSHV